MRKYAIDINGISLVMLEAIDDNIRIDYAIDYRGDDINKEQIIIKELDKNNKLLNTRTASEFNLKFFNKEDEVSSFIKSLRTINHNIRNIFKNGGCYQFHLLLKGLDNNAQCYINNDKNHVITKVNHKYYDIDGIVSDIDVIDGGYKLLGEEDLGEVNSWSFNKQYILNLE